MATSHLLLLVEDDRAIVDVVSRAFDSAAGYAVRTATSVREARRLLETVRPDLMIADLHLSDGFSHELCREVRARTPDIPIIATIGSVPRGMELPVADLVLRKPYGLAELRLAVEGLLLAGCRAAR